MSDALNLIALAKMAVVVIGIFLVPVITRKFASDLGLPAGQMAMNRAALAAGALGLGAGVAMKKLSFAALSSAVGHTQAPLAGLVGQKVRGAARSLLDGGDRVDHQGEVLGPSPLRKLGAKSLDQFGKVLENAHLKHKAKKHGVAPLTIPEQIAKTVSTDPNITRPIIEKEQRFQKFLRAEMGMSDEGAPSYARGGRRASSSLVDSSHNRVPATSESAAFRADTILSEKSSSGNAVTRSLKSDPIAGSTQLGAHSLRSNESPMASSAPPSVDYRWMANQIKEISEKRSLTNHLRNPDERTRK